MGDDIKKEDNNQTDETNEKICVSKDRIKLTLRRYTDIVRAKTGFWTWLGFCLSLITTLVTAEFQDFLGISAQAIKIFFFFLFCCSFIVTVVQGIKLISWKAKDQGDEEWFILELQGKKKEPKEKIELDSFDLKCLVGLLLKLLLYISPIILWIIVMCFVGWSNAWSRDLIVIDDLPMYPWLVSLICSLIWYVLSYMILISESENIKKWFDKTFYYEWYD